jgi:hypothetical protein
VVGSNGGSSVINRTLHSRHPQSINRAGASMGKQKMHARPAKGLRRRIKPLEAEKDR